MMTKVKDVGEGVIGTLKDRLDGDLSGPFIVSLLFVFWEIPIHLFSKHSEEKIKAIKDVIYPAFSWGPNLHRLAIVGIAWFFWVYIVPGVAPFFKRKRLQVLEWSLKMNKHESYTKLKKDLEQANGISLLFQRRIKHEQKFISDMETYIKGNNRATNLIPQLFLAIDKIGLPGNGEDLRKIKNVFNALEESLKDSEIKGNLITTMTEKISIASAIHFFRQNDERYTYLAEKIIEHGVTQEKMHDLHFSELEHKEKNFYKKTWDKVLTFLKNQLKDITNN